MFIQIKTAFWPNTSLHRLRRPTRLKRRLLSWSAVVDPCPALFGTVCLWSTPKGLIRTKRVTETNKQRGPPSILKYAFAKLFTTNSSGWVAWHVMVVIFLCLRYTYVEADASSQKRWQNQRGKEGCTSSLKRPVPVFNYVHTLVAIWDIKVKWPTPKWLLQPWFRSSNLGLWSIWAVTKKQLIVTRIRANFGVCTGYPPTQSVCRKLTRGGGGNFLWILKRICRQRDASQTAQSTHVYTHMDHTGLVHLEAPSLEFLGHPVQCTTFVVDGSFTTKLSQVIFPPAREMFPPKPSSNLSRLLLNKSCQNVAWHVVPTIFLLQMWQKFVKHIRTWTWKKNVTLLTLTGLGVQRKKGICQNSTCS